MLAKPAEQTPLVAAVAVSLLHDAGVPREVLQLLPGDGETVGNQLVCDPRVQGVMFTGSTAVAKILQRIQATGFGDQRDHPAFSTETGGQIAL